MKVDVPDSVLGAVRRWLQTMVVDEHLCPFAGPVLEHNTLRLVRTPADTHEQLLQALADELDWLQQHPAVATTLLVHPHVLEDFEDYNQFLDVVDRLLNTLGLDGIMQVASFHPAYQFADTAADDAENYANRAPYPLLHILRESSVADAIATHPDVAQIPRRNIRHLESIGSAALGQRLAALLKGTNADV